MTGMPAVDYKVSNKTVAELWEIMSNGSKMEFPMVAGTSTAPSFTTVAGHAETVLGVLKLSNGAKLVKMRNPWGSYKYSGPYSKGSKLWTAALKKEAKLDSADDGIFFTPISDWIK